MPGDIRSELTADVAIVGSGPAGLAAAAALVRRGIRDILVIERDDAPGGLPRFCHHPGFGWEYSRRLDSGPRFVRRLLASLPSGSIRLLLRTTALRTAPGPRLQILGPETGSAEVRARAVLVTTGIRESPRGARLVPGARPEHGILTTGLLQQIVARGVPLRARRMTVIGSEHVSFSAILTGRRAGVRTVAMLEAGDRIQSWPLAGLASRALGISLYLRSTVAEILGRDRVEAIVVRGHDGRTRRIDCDCVLFSGGWVPEATMLAESGAQLDPHTGGPIIDQLMRTTLPGVFAAGNVLRAVESSGQAALEGAAAAAPIAAFLAGQIGPDIGAAGIEATSPLAYVVPQRWGPEAALGKAAWFSSRANEEVCGPITMRVGSAVIYRGRYRRRPPNRQIRFAVRDVAPHPAGGPIWVGVDQRR